MPFVQADTAYRTAIESAGRELEAAFSSARAIAPDLNRADITWAILMRLKSYLTSQDAIKSHLNKVYAAPAADFFVETIVFYLRVALERLSPGLTIASEKNIVRRRGSMRPDISIWRGDRLISAIECKTQLGWNRDGWLLDFQNREHRLRVDCPDAKLYLLVMTGSNWPGFGDDVRLGRQFFVLLKDTWPRDIEVISPDLITHRFESLVNEIIAAAA